MKQLLPLLLLLAVVPASGQDATTLVKLVKTRLDKVRDYQAAATMEISVPFINAPRSEVRVFYRNPDKFRVQKPDGISVLPKGGVRVNMASLLAGSNYTVVDAGSVTESGVSLRVVKLLPLEEGGEVVLSTLYIDPAQQVIRRSTVVSKDGGSYEMLLDYGRYTSWGLPDKVTFVFAAKDFRLPKGVTFDYDKGEKKVVPKGDGKGRVTLTYSTYTINKGVGEKAFVD